MASIPQNQYVEIQYEGQEIDPLAAKLSVLERRFDAHIGKGGNVHASATQQEAGFMAPDDKTKLDGVETGATQNSTDAFLLNRGNHQGEQPIESVTGLRQELDDALAGGSNYRGLFPSLAALEAAIPVAVAGNYADVDEGEEIDAIRYIWDDSDQSWVSGGTGEPLTAPQVKALYESNPNTNAFTDQYRQTVQDLESSVGAGLVGYDANGNYPADSIGRALSPYFSTASLDPSMTDASDALQDLIDLADGRAVRITSGVWKVKNLNLSSAALVFDSGAVFYCEIGPEDDGLKIGSNVTLVNPYIQVLAVGAAPAHGGIGNGITIGEYVTSGEVYGDVRVFNPVIESLNTSYSGLAVSMVGRVEGVSFYGQTKLLGQFGGGLQAHWGGIFDGEMPHTGLVTESFHPNNIFIESLTLGVSETTGLGGFLGVSLSAAYNVTICHLANPGWVRSLWVQPGDVYDAVAPDDQKSLIMSGIKIRFIEIIDPKPNDTAYNNVLVSGISASIRVAGQTQSFLAADRNNMKVQIDEIRVTSTPSHTYTTGPIVRMVCAKDSSLTVEFRGFTDAVSSSLFQAIANVDCYSKVIGGDIARLFSGNNNIRHTYDIHWSKPSGSALMSSTHRVAILGAANGTATVGSAVAAGGTVVPVSSWTSVGSQYFPKGSRFYLSSGGFITLSESQLVGAGVASIKVEPLSKALASGDSLLRNGTETEAKVTGLIDGAYAALELLNTDDLEVSAKILRSAKYDVLLSGVKHMRPLFNGVFDQCGQLRDGSLLVNIYLGGSGVTTEGACVKGAKFEISGSPLVSSNVYGRSANNQHVALLVTDCDLSSTGVPVNYLWPTDEATLNAGPPQVYGNRNVKPMANASYDFDPQQGAVQSIGGIFSIHRNFVPPSGNWPAGSRFVSTSPAVGSPKAQLRTAAGTWVSEGNL